MEEHKHRLISNTPECFREFLGHKVTGVLFNTLPLGEGNLSHGTKTIIFECGYGLTISPHGTFWVESAENIHRAVSQKLEDLKRTEAELREVLEFAGLKDEGEA